MDMKDDVDKQINVDDILSVENYVDGVRVLLSMCLRIARAINVIFFVITFLFSLPKD